MASDFHQVLARVGVGRTHYQQHYLVNEVSVRIGYFAN
jgi:hypothetical protein